MQQAWWTIISIWIIFLFYLYTFWIWICIIVSASFGYGIIIKGRLANFYDSCLTGQLLFWNIQKIMWKLNKSIAKELLPTQPVDFPIEPCQAVFLVNLTLEEFKVGYVFHPYKIEEVHLLCYSLAMKNSFWKILIRHHLYTLQCEISYYTNTDWAQVIWWD